MSMHHVTDDAPSIRRKRPVRFEHRVMVLSTALTLESHARLSLPVPPPCNPSTSGARATLGVRCRKSYTRQVRCAHRKACPTTDRRSGGNPGAKQ